VRRVMIVAGEASGDMHAAGLVEAVHRLDPTIDFFGIGGPSMRRAGVDIMVESAELAVVGLIEVLAHYRVIRAALKRMQATLHQQKPDLLILTDYPDFNLRLAKTAKQLGVPVLYYISPQVWAWRQGRVKVIRERVDMMAVVFQFEEEFYRRFDVPVQFVGHPLVDEVAIGKSAPQLRDQLGLDSTRPTIGLFPGSRRSELKRLLPTILAAAEQLQEQRPDVQFVLPVAPTLTRADLEPYLHHKLRDLSIVDGRAREAAVASDVVITVSGTVTLELALLGAPMVIINRVAWLSYWILKRLVKVEHIGLCNIVAGERIAPELVQDAVTPANISTQVLAMLDDDDYRATLSRRLAAIRSLLGGSGGSRNAAQLVVEMLGADSHAST